MSGKVSSGRLLPRLPAGRESHTIQALILPPRKKKRNADVNSCMNFLSNFYVRLFPNILRWSSISQVTLSPIGLADQQNTQHWFPQLLGSLSPINPDSALGPTRCGHNATLWAAITYSVCVRRACATSVGVLQPHRLFATTDISRTMLAVHHLSSLPRISEKTCL